MKKALIIISVFALIGLSIFFFVERSKDNLEEDGSIKNIDLSLMEDDWYSINYTDEKVYIEMPKEWNPILGKDLTKGIVANFNDTFASGIAFVDYDMESDSFDLKAFQTKNPDYSINSRKIGEQQIIGYYGKGPSSLTAYEGDDNRSDIPKDFIENTYLIGEIIVNSDAVIQAECQTQGLEYSSLISSCNRIIESFRVSY